MFIGNFDNYSQWFGKLPVTLWPQVPCLDGNDMWDIKSELAMDLNK